jgi:hypothetical protein
MSTYKVTTVAQTQIQGSSTTGLLKTGPTTFSRSSINGTPYDVFPILVTSRIQAGASETWDLDNYYQADTQWMRVLVIKSTRPVTITVDGFTLEPTEVFTFTTPPTTYFHQVFESSETALGFTPASLTISNPPASASAPTPLPPSYPAAQVEVMVAVQESAS